MMTKQSSRTKVLFKKLAVIPVLAGFTFLFAERVEAQEEIIEIVEETPDVQKAKNDKILNKNYHPIEIVEQPYKATTKELTEYNSLAKKYNKQPKEKRIVKLKDIKRLEYLYAKLSKEQKKNAQPFPECPPPPTQQKKKKWKNVKYFVNDTITPQPPKQKTGFYEKNGVKLYFVKDNKGTTYYNRYGQVVTKEGKIINSEQTASDKVIPGQNITKVYKDNKVVTQFKNTNLTPPPPKTIFPEVKKGEMSNIPPPPKSDAKKFPSYPPPPPPMSAKELVFKYPSATYYFNNKKVSPKKILDLVKNQKGLSVFTQEKDGKKIIKFTSKDYVKKSLIKVKDQSLYYIKKNGKTEYFDRWGNKVDENGKT